MSAAITTPHTPWPTVKLGDVCEVINGLWKGTKPPLVNVGVIRATNFTKLCEFDASKTVYIDVEERKYLKRKLRFGDIVVERSGGGPNQPVGRVIYFNLKEGEYSLSNFTSALRVKDSIELDPYYLYRILTICYVSGVTEKMQSNSVQLRNLDFEQYLNIPIPLPPLEVQREIVAKVEAGLKEADGLVAHFKRLAALADETFKAELDETFTTLNTPTVKLGDVCEVRAGATHHAIQSEDGIYPVFGSGGYICQATEFRCPANTVTVGRKGTLDKPLLIEEPFWNIDTCFGVIPGENIRPHYLWHFCQNFDFYHLVPSLGRPSTNSDAIKSISIPLPSLDIQREIVGKLEAVKVRCERLKAEAERGLKAAEALRKAVLAEAFES